MAETDEDPTAELTVHLSRVARSLFQAGSVGGTLQLVVELAVESIDGCESAGILMGDAAVMSSGVSARAILSETHELERRLEEGPCRDAARDARLIYVGDLAEDERWPRYGPEAMALGWRSLLAVQLAGDGTLGALGLYSRLPYAFGIADRGKALIFATFAGLALAAAHLHEDEERRLEELHRALTTRELIGQAQGIIMERERITADQAFDVLRVASQHLNVKLRDVARGLVETGTIPPADRGGPRS